jgi:hypothetical protein
MTKPAVLDGRGDAGPGGLARRRRSLGAAERAASNRRPPRRRRRPPRRSSCRNSRVRSRAQSRPRPRGPAQPASRLQLRSRATPAATRTSPRRPQSPRRPHPLSRPSRSSAPARRSPSSRPWTRSRPRPCGSRRRSVSRSATRPGLHGPRLRDDRARRGRAGLGGLCHRRHPAQGPARSRGAARTSDLQGLDVRQFAGPEPAAAPGL